STQVRRDRAGRTQLARFHAADPFAVEVQRNGVRAGVTRKQDVVPAAVVDRLLGADQGRPARFAAVLADDPDQPAVFDGQTDGRPAVFLAAEDEDGSPRVVRFHPQGDRDVLALFEAQARRVAQVAVGRSAVELQRLAALAFRPPGAVQGCQVAV